MHRVFSHLKELDLANKWQLAMKQCKYLGHVIGNGLIQPELDKIDTVKSFTVH